MKKILISLIFVLLVILLVSIDLYYFRDAKWNDVYSDNVLEMLMEDFNGDVELSVERITSRDKEVYIYLDEAGKQYFNGLEVLVLNRELGLISEDIDNVLRGKNISLKLETQLESKSLFSEMLCSYLGGEHCDRSVSLSSWSLSSIIENNE